MSKELDHNREEQATGTVGSGSGMSRRDVLRGAGAVAVGAAAIAATGGVANAQAAEGSSRAVLKEIDGIMTSTISLDWKEVYYTNCPLISASNVDQELGWTREEFKKLGVKFAFMRSVRETDWYPHYIHNQDNLIRFGGLFPPIQVHADYRRTRMLGLTHVPYEGGCMLVRAKDKLYRMSDLKGKRIALSKSLNTLKNDWWRIQEEQAIEAMLMMNGMTRKDVKIVEFPYPDDWYNKPAMLDPMENPSELWLKRDHKRDLAFRPAETALLEGKVDAIYTQSKVFQHLQEATGELAAIEDLSRYPDWRLQAANIPAIITCTDVMAEQHPELVVAFMKGMIKVGRWSNEHKHAAAAILNRQTFYLDVEDTYEGIRLVDMVPNLSAQNLALVNIGKEFMLSHGYIKNDFDVEKWAAPEFLAQAGKELLEDMIAEKTQQKIPTMEGRIG
ncbi:MAG: ABC transporter substrate-binding protein [Gammaproteobacteria bacterium]|nr:ABC transporter substrate-binding protein [Gammaproteobacteria bacterium]